MRRPRLALPSLAMAWWGSLAGTAQGYIPAVSTNDTSALHGDAASWIIQLAWQPNGIFRDGVSLQLQADGATKSQWQGVLLHFSEVNATTQLPSAVPWIALINCDTNTTTFSLDDDIFTLARDHGATAAMLFSETSQGCVINQDYLVNFGKVLDVFSSGNLQGSRLIESQFSNVVGSGFWFDSASLNTSAPSIMQQINSTGTIYNGGFVPSVSTDDPDTSSTAVTSTETPDADSANLIPGAPYPTRVRRAPQASSNTHSSSSRRSHSPSPSPTSPTYLIATLASANATLSAPSPTNATAAGGGTGTGQSLALIVLYAITGCVALMFLVVIISGAVRAVRHPDRYGPRAFGRRFNGTSSDETTTSLSGQTRAQGLGRAILDTFPVVKWGRGEGQVNGGTTASPTRRSKHVEDEVELAEVGDVTNSTMASRQYVTSTKDVPGHQEADLEPDTAGITSANILLPTQQHERDGSAVGEKGVEGGPDPLDIDDEHTCPICVTPFEEGDDIRVLPCDERHRFHQTCCDPWLLNVSKLCPLCRWDLSKRKDGTRIGDLGHPTTEATNATGEDENRQSTLSESTTVDGEESEAAAQVVANLRAMLESQRSGGSHSTSHEDVNHSTIQNDNNHNTTCTSGQGNSGFSRSRFVKYVAAVRKGRKRRTTNSSEQHQPSPPSSSSTSPFSRQRRSESSGQTRVVQSNQGALGGTGSTQSIFQ